MCATGWSTLSLGSDGILHPVLTTVFQERLICLMMKDESTGGNSEINQRFETLDLEEETGKQNRFILRAKQQWPYIILKGVTKKRTLFSVTIDKGMRKSRLIIN